MPCAAVHRVRCCTAARGAAGIHQRGIPEEQIQGDDDAPILDVVFSHTADTSTPGVPPWAMA